MTKTPQEKQAILKQGLGTEFWLLLVEALNESKVTLQSDFDSEEFSDLPADQYKLNSELIKAKKKYIDKMINLPDSIISWLNTPDSSRPNFDPYEK